MSSALKKLSNYYDKIFVVSIERTRKDRSEKLKTNLKGLQYEIFEGTDASLLNEEQLNALADLEKSKDYLDEFFLQRYGHTAGRALRKSEVGCSYSHIKVYEAMIENGWERVLILEDDAKIDFNKLEHIHGILEDIPQDCELIYWGYRWHDSESPIRRMMRLYIQTPIKKIKAAITGGKYENENLNFPTPFKTNVWNAGFHAGTHAYAINRAGAKKMLELNKPVVMNADQALAYLRHQNQLKCYVAMPIMFREDQSVPSSLTI